MKQNKKQVVVILGLLAIGIALFFLIKPQIVSAADPVGPDSVDHGWNQTKSSVAARQVNISGGYIASFNLSSTTQNRRWKGFVGHVTGMFTLDDAGGSSIYDWVLGSVAGRVYATRNETSVTWSQINCSNTTTLEAENLNMNLTNQYDNLTATFNTTSGATHSLFYTAGRYIPENECPTLNTYKSNATQDDDFEEMALYDGTNIVYATIIENDVAGYDGGTPYDFQMIVPERGEPGYEGVTPYYLYIEID